jgi:hypothetical protein
VAIFEKIHFHLTFVQSGRFSGGYEQNENFQETPMPIQPKYLVTILTVVLGMKHMDRQTDKQAGTSHYTLIVCIFVKSA